MHHHTTASWLLLISAAFVGTAACSFGSSSLFFFSPFFYPQNISTSGNNNNNVSSSSSLLQCTSDVNEDYLACAFMYSNISSALMFIVGAIVVSFGGTFDSNNYFGGETAAAAAASPSTGNESDSNNNVVISSTVDEDGSNVEVIPPSTDNFEQQQQQNQNQDQDQELISELPGERYFRLYYVSCLFTFLFGGITSLLSSDIVNGGPVILQVAIGCAIVGSCFCGISVLSLLAGMSIRWPNLYEVLFEGVGRGDHSCKPRKVNRVGLDQQDGGGVYQQQGQQKRSLLRTGSNAFASIDDEHNTLDYLHYALTTPPALVFSAFLVGFCVSCFFANVVFESVAPANSRTRSSQYALVLMCLSPLFAFLFGKVANCCSSDSFGETFDEAQSMGTSRGASPFQGENQQQQHIIPNSARSQATTLASVRSMGTDGIGWSPYDFTPDLFRSGLKIITYSLADVLGDEEAVTDSSRYFFIDTTMLGRRAVLRIFRSLRLLGTFLVFFILPIFLCSVVASQVRIVQFRLSSQPEISSHIYDRLSALNMQPPFALGWWLLLWLMTKAVFYRGGVMRYVAIGFSLLIFAVVSLYFLQSQSEIHHGGDGESTTNTGTTRTKSGSGDKLAVVEFSVLLPPLLVAACHTQVFVFTLSLAFISLPRPLFPIASSVIYCLWSLGELTAVRPNISQESSGYFLISILLGCSILVLTTYLSILKWKNAFENPRALFFKMKQDAQDEASRQEASEESRRRQQQGHQQYGSNVYNNSSSTAANIGGSSNDNDPRRGSTLSQQATTMFDVLPPHRMLHWSPYDIDTAFTLFDSTESVYAKDHAGASASANLGYGAISQIAIDGQTGNQSGGSGGVRTGSSLRQDSPSAAAAHVNSSFGSGTNTNQNQPPSPFAPPFQGGGSNLSSASGNQQQQQPNQNLPPLARRPKGPESGLGGTKYYAARKPY